MSSLSPQITKTLENDIFLLFLILIPTKSVTFAHCGLVFVDKASTDGEEQQPSSLTGGQPNLQPSNPYLQKLPSSLTGGLPNLQPSKPYLQ